MHSRRHTGLTAAVGVAVLSPVVFGGCTATGTLASSTIQQLRPGLEKPLAFPATAGGVGVKHKVVLTPNGHVRGVAADGAKTPWLEVGNLMVSSRGLHEGQGLRLGSARQVAALRLDESALKQAEALAPQGAEVKLVGDHLELKANADGVLADWVQKLLQARARAKQTLGFWDFECDIVRPPEAELKEGETVPACHVVTGEALLEKAGKSLADVRLVTGFEWRDATAVELRFPGDSGMKLALSPILLPFWLLAALANGGQDADAPDGEKGAPFLLEAEEQSESLFSSRAKRRSTVRPLFLLDGGLGVADGTVGAGAGVRLFDALEAGAQVRWIHGPPIQAGEAENRVAIGMRIAWHIDEDADPRFGFVLAGEAGRTTNDEMFGTLAAGPRCGLGHDVFLSVPLRLQAFSRRVGEGEDAEEIGTVRFLLSLELGWAP